MFKNITGIVLVLLAFVFYSGCGGSECAKFELLDSTVQTPSVVTLYYHVQTCGGDALPNLGKEDFVIKEDGRRISIYESDQNTITDPRLIRLSTMLLLDMSGSIINSGSLAPLQEAAKIFVSTIGDETDLAIYTFDGRIEIQLLVDFTKDKQKLTGGIDSLSDYEVVDNSTNLNGAVLQAIDILNLEKEHAVDADIFSGSIAIFTDGTDQAARVSDEEAIAKARESDHSVFSIGLGGEVDKFTLVSIGKNGAFFASDSAGIEKAFSRAAQAIKDRARSFYILSYCSPKREGMHTLELSLDGYSGRIKQEFDASGFTGGCSANDFLPVDGDLDGEGEIE